MTLRFNVLGPLEVVGPEGPVDTGSPLQQRVLALLLASPNQIVSTDRLIEEIWEGSPPHKAKHSIQTYVSNLRRALGGSSDGEGLIETRRPGYRLIVESSNLDVLQFSYLIDQGLRLAPEQPEEAAELLREALAMWRGDPYLDMADEMPSLHSEAMRLGELRMSALETRIELELAIGRHGELVGELESLTASHPLRERLWGMLMVALYRSHRQGDALRTYQRARRALGEQLGIEPTSDLTDLEERILLHDPDLTLKPAARHNIPEPLSSFVGRRDELTRVSKLIADSRLVSIVGAAGSGKTRLALEVARSNVGNFPDGVWLIRLAPIRDGSQLATEILGAIGLDAPARQSPLEALSNQLATSQALILLDNCEHLLDAAASVARSLLERSPRVRLMTTSREPLAIAGEVVFPLRPMTVPDNRDMTPTEALEADAVRLFVERASAARSDFTIDGGNLQSVVDICRRVDGLPLAIELAAVRTASLGIDELRDRLDDRLGTLRSQGRMGEERHRALSDTIEWSYGLLSEAQKSLYMQLSVFSGSFSLGDAESVGADPDRTLDLLSDLVSKSLVVFEDGRYRMLETIKQHAREKLAEEGRSDQAHRALLGWAIDLAEEEGPCLGDPDPTEAIERLLAEHDNILGALSWALGNAPDEGLRVVIPMTQFWWIDHPPEEDPKKKSVSYLRVGSDWSELMLEAASKSDSNDELVARGMTATALLNYRLGQFEEATEKLKRADVMLEGSGNTEAKARAALYRALSSWSFVPWSETISMLRRALDLSQRADHRQSVLYSTLLLSWALVLGDIDIDEGVDHLHRFDETARDTGHPTMLGHATDTEALFRLILDMDLNPVPELLNTAVDKFVDVGHRGCLTHVLHCVALHHARRADLETAATVMGAAQALNDRLAIVVAPCEDRSDLIDEAGLRDLEPRVYERAISEGRSMGYRDTIDFVRSSLGSRRANS